MWFEIALLLMFDFLPFNGTILRLSLSPHIHTPYITLILPCSLILSLSLSFSLSFLPLSLSLSLSVSGVDPHSYTAAIFENMTLEQFMALKTHSDPAYRARCVITYTHTHTHSLIFTNPEYFPSLSLSLSLSL